MLFDFATASSPLSDSLVLGFDYGWKSGNWRPAIASVSCGRCGGRGSSTGKRCRDCGAA